LPPTVKRIHSDLAEENRKRRERLTGLLADMLAQARYFVAGQSLQINAAAPMAALTQALEYLITNTFNKMGYLRKVHDTPEQARQEIQAVLRSNDIGQQTLAMQMDESNPQGIEDLRTYVSLCTRSGRQVVVYDLIEKRYAVRPYGWPAEEVLLLLARLLVLGDISLMMDGALLPVEKAYAELITPNKQRKLIVLQRQTADPKTLQQARTLGQKVFSTMGPDGEDALYAFLRARLEACKSHWSTFTSTRSQPGTSSARRMPPTRSTVPNWSWTPGQL
jgi:hypothetical protein